METIVAGTPIEVLPVLDLALGCNKGVPFDLFADRGNFLRWPLVFLTVVAIIRLGIWLARVPQSEGRTLQIGLAFIIGGAIGNAADRIAFGHVTDFILFHVQSWFWPAFNVADIAISIGAALVLIGSRCNR